MLNPEQQIQNRDFTLGISIIPEMVFRGARNGLITSLVLGLLAINRDLSEDGGFLNGAYRGVFLHNLGSAIAFPLGSFISGNPPFIASFSYIIGASLTTATLAIARNYFQFN